MMDQSDASSLAIQPLLVVRDALRAIEFYSAVLGAREKWRLMHFDRVGHAVMRLDNAEFIILDEFPEAGIVSPLVADPSDPPPPGPRLLVRVDDVDAVLERAVAAGATLLSAAEDQWWGVRAGSFRDPFGHRWSVRTVREPITIQEMQRRADELGLYPPRGPTGGACHHGLIQPGEAESAREPQLGVEVAPPSTTRVVPVM